PVHELQRDGRLRAGVHAERLERRHHTKRAVQPAAIRDRIEVAADDHRLRRCSGERDPVIAGGVGVDGEAERRELVLEPGARLPPDGPPREALSAVGGGSPRGELAQVVDHAPRVHSVLRTIIGSTAVARRTGPSAAASAAAPSATAATPKTIGSVALTPKRSVRSAADPASAPASPRTTPRIATLGPSRMRRARAGGALPRGAGRPPIWWVRPLPTYAMMP